MLYYNENFIILCYIRQSENSNALSLMFEISKQCNYCMYVLGLSEFGAQSIRMFIRMYLYICIKLRSFQ